MEVKIDTLTKHFRVCLSIALGMAMIVTSGCSTTQASLNTNQVAQGTGASNEPVANPNVKQSVVLEGLERPWSIAWLPDGSQLITERPGRLRVVRNGVLEPTPVTGVPEVFAIGQGGLMDVSVHPRFAENRFIYLTYSHGANNANRTRMARAVFDGKSLQDVRVIFEVQEIKSGSQHFGSRIAWLPDNTMLLAIGDGGNPPIQLEGDLIRKQAQNRKSHLGKILRLNDDGSIPKNNPFVNDANANPAVWSYGHRNIQGLAFDASNKHVWSTEHGALGGDELNLVEAGKNYGWPIVTYSREYSGREITLERSRPDMVDPKTYWTPSPAPSGLAFYNSNRVPDWRGDLFSGELIGQAVRHIELDAKGNVTNQKLISIGQRVRDVRIGPDGLLYVLTDEQKGQLIRLEPAS